MQQKKKIIIGRHCLQKKGLVGAVEEALNYSSNALMIFLGAPQNSRRRKISSAEIKAFQMALERNNLDLTNVIVHAPYLINLANPDPVKFN